MNKLFLTISIVLSFCYSYGQVSFGVKAGLNISNAPFQGSDHSTRLGIHGGLVSKIKISRKFLVQPEILYSVKGYKYSLIGSGDDLYQYNLNILKKNI